MKTFTNKFVWSFYGLCLVLLVYACRNQDAEPLAPFTFDSLKELALPSLRVSAPPPVTVTPATITQSSQASQVKSGIASIPSMGSVPPVVTQAVANMSAALAAAGVSAESLNSSFTTQVINTLNSGGTLPTPLQATINNLVANPVLQPYFVTVTYPKVNGQTIGPTTTSIVGPGTVSSIAVPISISAIQYPSNGDPCFKQANDLYDAKIFGLEGDRQNQAAQVEATYTQAKASAEADVPGCVNGKLSEYNTLVTQANQALTTSLNDLNSAQATLGPTNYNVLKAFLYTLYAQQIQLYFSLRAAEFNTCAITSTIKVASAKFARDTDINTINSNFNATIRQAQRIVLQLFDSCHNQGTGN
ncbi:hypothetical protein [Spirosoma validum]|uniref:Uncharacterized protein n=1 Tax=Spirosoma validum TaxID=2771355 RepID=A0A927GD87_9BACT|nr:hypothetical protein [Spirosoma validum]MBD2753296.1 hypothetical protein [Spirosoma validum]